MNISSMFCFLYKCNKCNLAVLEGGAQGPCGLLRLRGPDSRFSMQHHVLTLATAPH